MSILSLRLPFCLLLAATCASAQDYLTITPLDSTATTTQTLVLPLAVDGTFAYVPPFFARRTLAAEETAQHLRVRVGRTVKGTVTMLADGTRSIAIEISDDTATWTPSAEGLLPGCEHNSMKTTVTVHLGEEYRLTGLLKKKGPDGTSHTVDEVIKLIDEREFGNYR